MQEQWKRINFGHAMREHGGLVFQERLLDADNACLRCIARRRACS